jgi:hypothetical protein
MALLINISLLPKLKIRRPLLKRVLDTEVDVLLSYYNQDGVHSAKGIDSSGIRISHRTVAVPLNDDDLLMSGFGYTLLQVILIHDESGASGASSPTHKPHLELLEVINWLQCELIIQF